MAVEDEERAMEIESIVIRHQKLLMNAVENKPLYNQETLLRDSSPENYRENPFEIRIEPRHLQDKYHLPQKINCDHKPITSQSGVTPATD